jgi:hypothetical protein
MDETGSMARKVPSYHKWTAQTYGSLLRTTAAMPQGQAVSESVQWIVVRLGATMSVDEISGYVDLGDRKVRDILAHFKKTGGVNVPKRERPTLHKSLQDEDIQV